MQKTSDRNHFWVIPFLFVMLMWLVYWLDEKYMLDLYRYGVLPQKLVGLFGVVTSPFVHGSLSHLVSNTFPIFFLGSGIAYFYPKTSNKMFLIAWIFTGFLVWLFGRQTFHIGASGVVYALAFFIFFSGLIRGHPQLIALSLLVAFLYGSLVWGMLPIEEHISWESHLYGGLVGLSGAIVFRRSNPKHMSRHFWHNRKYPWDEAEEQRMEEMDYWKTDEQRQSNSGLEQSSQVNYRVVYHYKDTGLTVKPSQMPSGENGRKDRKN